MSDLYKQPEVPVERAVYAKKTKSGFKRFLSTITAGVIGSALTLGAVTYTDYFDSLKQTSNQLALTEDKTVEEGLASIVPTSTAGSTSSIADIVESSSKAIVGITNLQNQNDPYFGSQDDVESGTGSGVVFKTVEGSAYIVTNNHVIEKANKVEVSLYNGEKTTAEVVGADALTDLAVIKIDSSYVTDILEFGDSSQLRPGEQVMAIGNPLGLDLSRTVTQGIISAIDRDIAVSTSAGQWELNVIQTDAAINPGNSGGALINTSGQVIGINSLKISDDGVEGLGFAIPSNDVVPIINQLIEYGKINRPYLGVNLADLAEVPGMYLPNLPEGVTAGTMITQVDTNSAAGRAGLKAQDVIVQIDNQSVENASDLRKYLYEHLKSGDRTTVKVYRDGKAIDVEVEFSNSPE
ncbi:serine protease Do [Mesobacillus persicus]|uniref:Serine protease Do n=1 Tax=Mesobacillus persicus TaxID=930146 RepID=A0A1H7ZPV2_9BACI|nr:trypsin-like peptidase domain-containing protein [Mesobacillus persicus]SEM60415.1 serine protease Do [Mesobacillus persicus]